MLLTWGCCFTDHQGSAGLILNCPSAGARVRSCTCLPDIAGAFKQQLLYQGGSVATERLHLLHGNPAVADTFEVMDVRSASCPHGLWLLYPNVLVDMTG